MKVGLFLCGLLIASAAAATAAQAQNYPWCAQYGGAGMGGAMNCGFSTYRQCMADVSGIGGFCQQNNTYRPPAGPHRRRVPG
jgi:hypothetical protein